MHSDTEKEYLLKALDGFNRKIMVISPEFKILAASGQDIRSQKIDIVGKLCHQVLYDRPSPCENCPAAEVVRTKKPAARSHQDHSQSQEKLSCLYGYPILSGKTIDALVMLDFDLPELGALEDELQRSNAFLRNLILSAVDGVIAADKKGKLLIFNDAAVEVSGYSVDEALNHLNIRDLYPGDGAREVMRKLRSEEYGGKGKLKTYHVNVLGKNKELIPISLYASIIYEGDREVATIGFFHDLRDRIRMQKDLEKTQLLLLQSEKMASLGKLSAGVAHQLNNPLAGIILFTKLVMEEYVLDEKIQDDLRRILTDAARCRDIVKELLEFSRQTSQLMRPHDVNKAISRILFLLENQTIFHNIDIEKSLEPSLPLVQANMQQLNHVFMNIILNAADAMEGKGKLTLKSYHLPDKDRVGIEISDTGPGIPEDIQNRIFDPFFTTKEEGRGTGLGLSMVYGIVETHGGKITAKSKPGEGATFIIELPIATNDNKGDESGE